MSHSNPNTSSNFLLFASCSSIFKQKPTADLIVDTQHLLIYFMLLLECHGDHIILSIFWDNFGIEKYNECNTKDFIARKIILHYIKKKFISIKHFFIKIGIFHLKQSRYNWKMNCLNVYWYYLYFVPIV